MKFFGNMPPASNPAMPFVGRMPLGANLRPWTGAPPQPLDLIGDTLNFPVSDEAVWAAEEGMSQAIASHQAVLDQVGVAWGFVDWSGVAGIGPIIGS